MIGLIVFARYTHHNDDGFTHPYSTNVSLPGLIVANAECLAREALFMGYHFGRSILPVQSSARVVCSGVLFSNADITKNLTGFFITYRGLMRVCFFHYGSITHTAILLGFRTVIMLILQYVTLLNYDPLLYTLVFQLSFEYLFEAGV